MSPLGQEPLPMGGCWCCLVYHAGAVFASLLIRLWRNKMRVSAKYQLTGGKTFTMSHFQASFMLLSIINLSQKS